MSLSLDRAMWALQILAYGIGVAFFLGWLWASLRRRR